MPDTHIRSREELIAELQGEIKTLARERNAVILAHNYERPEVQDVADFVGDSLGLSREAAKTERRRHRLLRRALHGRDGGDPVAAEDGAAARSRRRLLARRRRSTPSSCARGRPSIPGAVVVSYVNTTAEVKAESDYCCTSGNAVEIVNSIPADKEILFLPDMFLGAHVRRMTGRAEHPRLDGRVSRARRHRSGEHPAAARAASRTRSSSFIPSAAARRACSRRCRPATSIPRACRSSRPKG